MDLGQDNHGARWTTGDLGNDEAHRNKRAIVVEGTFFVVVEGSLPLLLPHCLGAGQSLVLAHTDHWLSSMFFDAAS